jgi:hypothetical protein
MKLLFGILVLASVVILTFYLKALLAYHNRPPLERISLHAELYEEPFVSVQWVH